MVIKTKQNNKITAITTTKTSRHKQKQIPRQYQKSLRKKIWLLSIVIVFVDVVVVVFVDVRVIDDVVFVVVIDSVVFYIIVLILC